MALNLNALIEVRANGDTENGGGFRWDSLVNSSYKWTASGSGTNEYYLEAAAGGDPGINEPNSVYLDGKGNLATNGTLGSLNASEWDWGDNDSLGYSTLYVRLVDGVDPDSKNVDFVAMGHNGGKDYTQQDSAQESYTTLAMTTGGTTLTCSGADMFDSLIVGNWIYISGGTNFNTGWAEVTSRTSSTEVEIDRDMTNGSNASSGTGNMGGAVFVSDALFESLIPKHKVYMKNDATYTFTESLIFTSTDGSDTYYISVEGYNSTRGDNPTGTDRPLTSQGSNVINAGDYWSFANIRLAGTGSQLLNIGSNNKIKNCSAENTSGSSDRYGFSFVSGGARIIDCESVSTNGRAFGGNTTGGILEKCYAHDSNEGYWFNFGDYILIDCIADTCTTNGVKFGFFDDNDYMLNLTIYNCGTGIFVQECDNMICRNITISDCTTGIEADSIVETQEFDYINLYNNTTDLTNIKIGENTFALDPQFTDAPNGDFSWPAGSNLENKGFGMRLGVG